MTYSALRRNTDLPQKSQFVAVLKNSYFGLFFDKKFLFDNAATLHPSSVRAKRKEAFWQCVFFAPVVFALAPLYMASRLLGLCYPMLIVLANPAGFSFGFRWIMLSIYVVLEAVVLALLLLEIAPLQHTMWHILPSRSNVILFSNDAQVAKQRLSEMKYAYSSIIVLPWIEAQLTKLFGRDVCDIVMHFYVSGETLK